MMKIENTVRNLIAYGLGRGLLGADDVYYAANGIFDALQLEPEGDFDPHGGTAERPLEEMLAELLADAVNRGIIAGGIASRDLLDTRIMGVLTPRPSEVTAAFAAREKESPAAATNYFYRLARDTDYIRTYRVRKDRKWQAETPYGALDITINLSKPEKDPAAIAAALTKKQDAYPKCLLCVQNEGYHGRLDHPARQNLRLIPMTLAGKNWFMQYSPYVYYNEHCIVLSARHTPMVIDHNTFVWLLQFVTRFPHYILGSNADLPIVGGSILTHEHYQGGRYEFPMARAGIRQEVQFRGFEDVRAGIVNWPMSVLRLQAADTGRLIELADRILDAWRNYTDEEADILAFTDAEGKPCRADYRHLPEGTAPHNTITPIARCRDGLFELDLVLRNNRTTEEHPLGIFHPHAELHHIKKENIGLIEVMGLAVLPARLLGEMEQLRQAMLDGLDIHAIPELAAHADWADGIRSAYPAYRRDAAAETIRTKGRAKAEEELAGIIEKEIGVVFSQVLEHAGVFKNTPAGNDGFLRFVSTLNR